MFRLIASNTQTGLRPVLLRKVRGNSSGLKLAPNMSLEPSFECQNHYAVQIARSNSTKAAASTVSNNLNLNQTIQDSAQFTSASRKDSEKVDEFKDLLLKVGKKRPINGRGRADILRDLQQLFSDDEVKAGLTSDQLQRYAEFLDNFMYQNRRHRLSSSLNRDSDHYQNHTLNNDIALKSAILDIADGVIRGVLQENMSSRGLYHLFQAMLQSEVSTELIELWEAGVNSKERVNQLFLKHDILSIVLPVAYKTKRFTYQDVLRIYEFNTKGKHILCSLMTAMGKIAIQAGDNSRGLDNLESLMKVFEDAPNKLNVVLHSLGDLHLLFIGDCQDIKIAKHFFDKVVNSELPYKVVLRAPYVANLLQNSYDTKVPFTTIANIWKLAIDYYTKRGFDAALNSKYAIVNNTFFKIFFKVYPELNEEAYTTLKQLIATYSKPVDEILINSILGNYHWNDKVVFKQLVDNFEIHNVQRTPVSYRVCLKKMGEIEDFTNEEILAQWYESLAFLDKQGFNYIPIADWAALRDSTIMSPYSEKRASFYVAVLDAFKNYHQDDKACLRFVRWFTVRDQAVDKIAPLSLEDSFKNECDIDVVIPSYRSLKENVNYKAVTKLLFKTHLKHLSIKKAPKLA